MLFNDRTTTLQSGGTIFVAQPRLAQWYESAPRGATMVYATGDVSHDRSLANDPGGLLSSTASYALKLSRMGFVQLTQYKLGDCRYEYRIRKL